MSASPASPLHLAAALDGTGWQPASWREPVARPRDLFTAGYWNRHTFVGAPATIARTIDDYVQADAGDGFILVPHITPTGLDDFAHKVVPLLQEQGVFRTEYEGTTLRDHLGLAHPDEASDERAAS